MLYISTVILNIIIVKFKVKFYKNPRIQIEYLVTKVNNEKFKVKYLIFGKLFQFLLKIFSLQFNIFPQFE